MLVPPCKIDRDMANKLSHSDGAGHSRIVDLSGNPATEQKTEACAWAAMSSALLATLLLYVALGVTLCAAQSLSEQAFSVPSADAPELAPRGTFAVGVRTVEIKNPAQPDILNFDKASGRAPLYDRPLTVEVWYPAIIPSGKEERTTYEMPMPGIPATTPSQKTFAILGKALRDAPPVTGKFPLVVVSHGYPGSRVFLSYLTENLASKGYIVASIDHTDSVLGAVKPFPSTLLNRASDQLFTVGAIEEMSKQSGNFLSGMVDDTRVAIIGYSMGGYGALASAGAGYSKKGMAAGIVAGGYLDDWTAGNPKYAAKLRSEVKAVVAIAPWGAQPPLQITGTPMAWREFTSLC